MALLDKVWQVVYAAHKAVFLWQAVDGLAVAVTRASRGRGETDQPLYVNGALEARTGTLGLEQKVEELHVLLLHIMTQAVLTTRFVLPDNLFLNFIM